MPRALTSTGRALALAPAVLGLLLTLGVSTAFSACDPKPDGTWMHCHDCQNTVAAGGVGLAALFGAAAFVRNGRLRAALQLAGVALAVVVFLVPGVLCPMCMMRSMRCYTVFQPFTRVMTGLTGLSGLGAAVQALRAGRPATPAPGTGGAVEAVSA